MVALPSIKGQSKGATLKFKRDQSGSGEVERDQYPLRLNRELPAPDQVLRPISRQTTFGACAMLLKDTIRSHARTLAAFAVSLVFAVVTLPAIAQQ